MFASRITEIQIALVVLGIAMWGYGARTDNDPLKWAGIGCFAAATALRFIRKRRNDSSA